MQREMRILSFVQSLFGHQQNLPSSDSRRDLSTEGFNELHCENKPSRITIKQKWIKIAGYGRSMIGPDPTPSFVPKIPG